METKESYTPQEIADWLNERKIAIRLLIDGLANALQTLILVDDERYEEEKKEALSDVADAREKLQYLLIMTERSKEE